jgi:RHS repeat-associated protein
MMRSTVCASGVRFSRSLFTQKERDSYTGNDYFEARYYSSALGRFNTPDWSAKATPVPYAVFDDPQSLNLYAYVRNNPVIHVDADGHVVIADDVVIGLAVATVFTVAVVQAYNNTPEGQRNIQNISNQAEENFKGNMHAVKNTVSGWFSKKAPPPPTPKPADSEAKPNAEPAEQGHTSGARASTHDDHTKPRPGTSPPPNYKPHRKFQQPKNAKTKNAPKPPYIRKDRD